MEHSCCHGDPGIGNEKKAIYAWTESGGGACMPVPRLTVYGTAPSVCVCMCMCSVCVYFLKLISVVLSHVLYLLFSISGFVLCNCHSSALVACCVSRCQCVLVLCVVSVCCIGLLLFVCVHTLCSQLGTCILSGPHIPSGKIKHSNKALFKWHLKVADNYLHACLVSKD